MQIIVRAFFTNTYSLLIVSFPLHLILLPDIIILYQFSHSQTKTTKVQHRLAAKTSKAAGALTKVTKALSKLTKW